jgi:DNA helicase-2/ATP-dependent DNA helicase PcrA
MEETIFPGTRAIGEREEMEEERRLCYVAITRAKRRLYLTCASQRMLFGRTNANRMSRFISEIPNEYLERSGRDRYDREREYGGAWRDSSFGTGSTGGYSGGYAANGSYSSYSGASERRGGSAGADRTGSNRPSRAHYGDATIGTRSASRGSTIDLKKGEMVQHDAFGQGLVISVSPMGGDALVEIAFDNVGTKRLMYKSAASHMHKVQ